MNANSCRHVKALFPLAMGSSIVVGLLASPLGTQQFWRDQQPSDLVLLHPQDDHIVIEKNTQVAVVVPESISSKHSTDAEGLVASDVIVQGVVIIRRGEKVLLNLAVAKPRSLSVGAVLKLYIEAVPTLIGTEIPLIRELKLDAGPGCADLGCAFVLLAPWVKGPHATIPAGTLIGAYVAERTEIPAVEARSAYAALLGEREKTSSGSPAKVFVYMLSGGDSRPPWPYLTLKIDAKKVDDLGPGEWACFAVAAGHHTLQAAKEQFELDVAANQTYYLRMVSADASLKDILPTPGFMLDDQALQQSIPKKAFKTDCW
ncbi:MAG: hypothetical protein ACRD50_07315 [Candidatus Acidiferrales bacterium]